MNPALVQALNQLGYIDGATAIFEQRFTEGRDERFAPLAEELVGLDVDVLFTLSGPAAMASRAATETIPIVMVGVSDPVGRGLAASLAHPGGNVTGIANLQLELNLKRIELLKEAVPTIARVVSVGNWDPTLHAILEEQDVRARAIGVSVKRIVITAPSELDSVAAAIARERPDALMLLPVPLTYRLRREFAELALAQRLRTIGWHNEQPLAGILMTYAPNTDDIFRRAAAYADKILKGAKPADLPIEQPTKFELIINLKTAKALGITLPASLVARADEVIE